MCYTIGNFVGAFVHHWFYQLSISCSDKLARELDVRSTHLQVFTLVAF
ncbi:unnamed protein product [Acanthoscelides obtectus]|uniref:Uncharacterized protein n=1 Tax=Acanthoscelides obtectus TaxID=200917 RepID=A0A9P0VSS8_ACAOB|nr:unnamed protein product [Acanthoscelides obtectus]CAK1688325.1 hypothetical protein AOBTE_LOCUS36686 [Acanthoscelides obtectus]